MRILVRSTGPVTIDTSSGENGPGAYQLPVSKFPGEITLRMEYSSAYDGLSVQESVQLEVLEDVYLKDSPFGPAETMLSVVMPEVSPTIAIGEPGSETTHPMQFAAHLLSATSALAPLGRFMCLRGMTIAVTTYTV